MLCKCSLFKDVSSILALWFKLWFILLHYNIFYFATTHVVISVRHPITYWSPHPLPNPPNTLKIYTGEMKFTARVGCGPSIHAFFQLKTFPIPRRIIPKNFSSLGFAVLEELGNKQTNTQTHSLTDRLVLW